jgi:hypothetical protein
MTSVRGTIGGVRTGGKSEVFLLCAGLPVNKTMATTATTATTTIKKTSSAIRIKTSLPPRPNIASIGSNIFFIPRVTEAKAPEGYSKLKVVNQN